MTVVNEASFPDVLLAERLDAGYTREQFAKKVGVLKEQVARWERGQQFPRDSQLIAIARVLGMKPSEFMARNGHG